jgi:uncharacterized protein (TIGR03435 family)
MVGTKSTMAGLAATLTPIMNQQVQDETGLKGYYDFDVRWTGPEALDGQAHETQFGSSEFVGGLISVLQNQFGLRVTTATGPVEYWVIDHVDPPTEN